MRDLDRRQAGKLYHPIKTGDMAYHGSMALIEAVNACGKDTEKARPYLEELFGSFEEDACVVAPLFVDLGYNIHLGKHSFINAEFLALDEGMITIGDYVQIGPRCSIYTAHHPFMPEIRKTGLETARNVTIEDGVWIGGSVVICGGVTIGKGSVIGAGSVVTKSIPAHVVAAGNPCRVIREISKKDEELESAMLEDYLSDPDCSL